MVGQQDRDPGYDVWQSDLLNNLNKCFLGEFMLRAIRYSPRNGIVCLALAIGTFAARANARIPLFER